MDLLSVYNKNVSKIIEATSGRYLETCYRYSNFVPQFSRCIIGQLLTQLFPNLIHVQFFLRLGEKKIKGQDIFLSEGSMH